MSDEPSRETAIGSVIEHVIACRRSGEPVRLTDVIRRHRELTPELTERLRLIGRAMRESDRRLEYGRDKEAETGKLRWLKDGIPGYEVLECVDRGGQGIVYRARQHSTNRSVAIKLLPEGPLADERKRRRFLREIELLTKIRHPNLVRAFDAGRIEGADFVVLEYVDGMPIDDFAIVESLGIREVFKLFADVCDAIAAAHRHGIIHRDLKPSNILVDNDGQAHVLDFGLAKEIIDDTADVRPISMTGQIVGSPPYLAPEQVLGGDADARTEVYTLGVVLFETISGSLPYVEAADRPELLRQIRDAAPARLRDVVGRYGVNPAITTRDISADLERVLVNALAKDPAQRYQTVAELAADVHRLVAQEPVEARSNRTLQLIRTIVRRHRVACAVAATALLAIVIGLFVSAALWRRAENVVEQTQTALRMSGLLNLGSVARDGGRFDDAMSHYRAAIELGSRFDKPVDELLHELYDAQYRMGEFFMIRQEPQYAAPHVAATLGIAEELLGRAPDNALWKREMALARRLAGRMQLELKNPLVAIERFNAAIRELEALPDQQRHIALTYVQLARAQMDLKRFAESLDSYAVAERLFEALADAQPEFLIDLASTHAKMGVLHWRSGDRDQAALRFERAITLLESVQSTKAAALRSEEIRRVRDAAQTNLAKLRA